jgi:putative aldouronate transport system permease protein
VQTITYAPHFISVVVLVGMLYLFLSPSSGIINGFIKLFGGDPVYFMGSAAWFKTIYVISGIWQNAGWGTIVYLAALSSVSPALYEAATIDGASRFMKIIYIDLFAILPTAVIMLILNMGTYPEYRISEGLFDADPP